MSYFTGKENLIQRRVVNTPMSSLLDPQRQSMSNLAAPAKALNSNNRLRAEAPAFIPLDIFSTLFVPKKTGPSATIGLQNAPRQQIPQVQTGTQVPVSQVPQCSRYSRRSVRSKEEENSNGNPRPILGNRNVLPRAILGRKENMNCPASEKPHNTGDEFTRKEFRSISRRMHRMKMAEENKKPQPILGAHASNGHGKGNENGAIPKVPHISKKK